MCARLTAGLATSADFLIGAPRPVSALDDVFRHFVHPKPDSKRTANNGIMFNASPVPGWTDDISSGYRSCIWRDVPPAPLVGSAIPRFQHLVTTTLSARGVGQEDGPKGGLRPFGSMGTVWVPGAIDAGARGYFVLSPPEAGQAYQITVESFDLNL